MQYFDVVIIGGGLVGSSFARAIAATNISTLIVDHAAAESSYSTALDNRGLALSYSSKQALENLQCWRKIAPKAYPISQVHVSEQSSFGFTKLCASRCGVPALGYVVSANDLSESIIADLEKLPDITVRRPVTIDEYSFDASNSSWSLAMAGDSVQCKILVIADGGNADRYNKLGIAVNNIDYQQTALVTNIFTTQREITSAYERFTKQGVLALLPFGNNRLKCVWTLDNADLQDFKTCSDLDFINKVQQAIGFRVGKFTQIDARKYFPIKQTVTTSLFANNAVLLGNAANTLHPVAAQGFNLGLRDAVTLAQVLRQAKKSGVDFNTTMLQHYAELRQYDHQQTRNFTNSLITVFGATAPLIKVSRRLGLLAAQFVPILNKKIAARGLGTWT